MDTSLGDHRIYLVCAVMVGGAAAVHRLAQLGDSWAVPRAAGRATAQLAAIATVLAAAMAHLWSAALVLTVMFGVAAVTAMRRSQASRGAAWLVVAVGSGVAAVIPLLLVSGVLPLTGVAVVPTFGIILGGTMTAVAVAARRALDAVDDRAGEVDAALSLGFSDREARMLVIRRPLADALIPNLDQARTAGLVTLPGAFIGVLLSTGSAAQAGVVQVIVIIGLLFAQSAGVAVVGLLVGRGTVCRGQGRAPRCR